jgi:hypothetical protein
MSPVFSNAIPENIPHEDYMAIVIWFVGLIFIYFMIISIGLKLENHQVIILTIIISSLLAVITWKLLKHRKKQ